MIPSPDIGYGGVPHPGASREVVLASPDKLYQHVAALGHLGETVCQVLGGVDIAHLLNCLLLLDALPQLNDVRVQPVVLGGRLEVVDVAGESLVVGESAQVPDCARRVLLRERLPPEVGRLELRRVDDRADVEDTRDGKLLQLLLERYFVSLTER